MKDYERPYRDAEDRCEDMENEIHELEGKLDAKDDELEQAYSVRYATTPDGKTIVDYARHLDHCKSLRRSVIRSELMCDCGLWELKRKVNL